MSSSRLLRAQSSGGLENESSANRKCTAIDVDISHRMMSELASLSVPPPQAAPKDSDLRRQLLLERASGVLARPASKKQFDTIRLLKALMEQLRDFESHEDRALAAEKDAATAAALRRDAEARAAAAELNLARMKQEIRTLQGEIYRLQQLLGRTEWQGHGGAVNGGGGRMEFMLQMPQTPPGAGSSQSPGHGSRRTGSGSTGRGSGHEPPSGGARSRAAPTPLREEQASAAPSMPESMLLALKAGSGSSGTIIRHL